MSVAATPVALAFAASVGWKLYQVTRAPDDRQLRAVTLCLASAAVAYPIGLPEGQRAVDAVVGAGTAKLVQNFLLLVAMYWLMCFYLYSANDQARGRRRARWEAVPLLATAGVIAVATVITPVSARNHTYATADMRILGLAMFYLSAGAYLVYALAMALHWTLRHARVAPRPHSTGLGLAAVAMAGMVLAGSARLVFVVIRWQGDTVPSALPRAASLTVTFAIPVFLAGVTYPVLHSEILRDGVSA